MLDSIDVTTSADASAALDTSGAIEQVAGQRLYDFMRREARVYGIEPLKRG